MIEQEIKIGITKLPEITRKRGIKFSSMIIYGTSLIALFGFGIGIGVGDYHTPLHSNTFSVYTQFVSQMLMTVRF
jgi:hypothetical protein